MLVYGDVMTDYNPFLSILQTYSEIDKEVALIALPESSKEFGNVYLDHEMKISRLVENPKANQANYVFAGMFVLFPKIFSLLEMMLRQFRIVFRKVFITNMERSFV